MKEIKKIIKKLKLPEKSKFLGYSIYLEKTDEYLVSCNMNGESMNLGWTKIAEMARCLKKLENTKATRDLIKPEASVVYIFDTGSHVITAPVEES